VRARGGGLGQSSSEGRRHLGDVGGDVVGLASGGAQGVLGLGLSERQRPLETKRDRETEIDLPLWMPM
jgi:hypothetical protein